MADLRSEAMCQHLGSAMQVMHNTRIHMQSFRLPPLSPLLWKNMKCHRLLVARAVPQSPEVAVHERQAATNTVDIQQQSSADSNNVKLTPSQRRNLRRKRKAASRQDISPNEAGNDDTGPGEQAAMQPRSSHQD